MLNGRVQLGKHGEPLAEHSEVGRRITETQ